MADIDIQKKKNNPIWPWIFGILALFAVIFLIYWLASDDDGRENAVVADTDTTQVQNEITAGTSDQVDNYLTWAADMENMEMGIHHNYTQQGLQNLAMALASVAERTDDVNKAQFEQKLTTMRMMADSITNDWESTQHANLIKRSFTASVDVMKELQQSSFSELQGEVSNLDQEVAELNPQELTLEQKESVKSFFRQSADVLEKMDNRISG